MDRYYFSTASYQGALGFDPQKIKADNEKFAPQPDRVLIFHNPPEKSLERIESAREGKSAFERSDYLINVQKIFKSFTGSRIRFIASDAALEEVHEQVLLEVQDLFDRKIMKRFVIAITGASGVCYGKRLFDCLKNSIGSPRDYFRAGVLNY